MLPARSLSSAPLEGYIGKYRKAHLTAGDRRFLSAGDTPFQTFDTMAAGKVGLMLGQDVRFPEVARVQFVQQATIIAAGFNADDHMFAELARTRSAENRIFVLSANRVGSEGDTTFSGRSLISGGSRVVIVEAGPSAEQTIVADLNLDTMIDKTALRMIDRVSGKARAISFVLDRRPELYGPLCWRRPFHEIADFEGRCAGLAPARTEAIAPGFEGK